MITQEQLNAINEALVLSIIHGGDTGGAYFSLNNYEDKINTLAKKIGCDVIWYDMCGINKTSIVLSNIYTKYDFNYGKYHHWPWLTLKNISKQKIEEVTFSLSDNP